MPSDKLRKSKSLNFGRRRRRKANTKDWKLQAEEPVEIIEEITRCERTCERTNGNERITVIWQKNS